MGKTLHKYWPEILLSLVFVGLLTAWLTLTPAGFMGKLWAIASSVCEQNPLHTLSFNGKLLPLCARCTGTFLGAFVSLTFLITRGRAARAPTLWKCIFLGAFALAFAVDGTNSFLATIAPRFSLYVPNNSLRFLTGMGMGMVIGVILWPVWNETIWNGKNERKVLEGWKALPGLLLCETAAAGMVLIKVEWFYSPVGVLSVIMVPVLITMIYTLLWIVGSKKENQVNCKRELIRYVELGAICALVQISLFDLVRFLLLGSWQGIQF